MDLARLSAKPAQLDSSLASLETMRTHLFAALVAALSTNVAVAQDDNAIMDMISNPILCVSAAHE